MNSDDKQRKSLLDEIRQIRANADKGREPELLSSRMGTRMYSVGALLERITSAFLDEHSGGSDALQAAETEAERLKLLLATVDYVLAVESIQIRQEDKAEIMRRAYAEIFTFGPLDVLFADETITTITIEGADKIAVRYGHGDLTPLDPVFEDDAHVKKIIRRLLIEAGADLLPEEPIIEAGLQVGRRRICVNAAGPPVSLLVTADIRVHPVEQPTLEDMVEAGYTNARTAEMLDALARSPHGLVIVGDTESGKTTLLGALVQRIPVAQRTGMAAVERAGELNLPEDVMRYIVRWRHGETEGVTFAEQVAAALEKGPSTLLLDEVRADEAPAVAPLLSAEQAPRQIWVFPGPADSKRLASALGMLARRSDTAQGEALLRPMYERLPFVVTTRRRRGQAQIYGIGEWQYSPRAEYPDFVELMAPGWDDLELTGNRPTRNLDLPGDFWG